MKSRSRVATVAVGLVTLLAGSVAGQERPLRRIPIPTIITSVAFSPEGDTLLAWDPAGWSRWDATTGRQRGREVPIAKMCERNVALPHSEDGRVIAAQCRNRLAFFETATARALGERQLREQQSAALYTAALNGSTTALVMAGATDTVVIGALTGSTPPTELRIGAEVEQLALSSTGTRLSVGTSRGVEIRDLPGGALLRTIGATASHALSADGRQLAVVSDRGVQLFDVEAGTVTRELEGRLPQLRFSPDGRLLAGWTNQRVTLWDTATGAQRLVLTSDEFVGATISPDGRLLATVSLERRGEGTASLVAVWQIPPG